jgi:hypothetical protein
MDSIARTARDFFINQQGMSPDQADMIVSQGLQAYNQQTQPRSMMQMASGGIARLGYQMGGSPVGVQSMPMDYGQSLSVPSQQQPMFTSTGNATSSPLLNYGQTGIGKAGGTPLSRNGYQEGGLTDFYNNKEPIIPRIENIGGLLDQAEQSIGEPQNNFTSPLATTFSGFGMQSNGMQGSGIARLGYQMGGEAVMPDMSGTDMSQIAQIDPQQALTVILQMLVEKGIPLEEAKKLAIKIIELFTQGGAPAVEQFANQLRQQEQSQAMATGGIAGYAKRQGYGWGDFVGDIFGGAADLVGDVVGGIGDVVSDIAKSPIGKIAMTAAAVYFGGPMLASGLGISSAAGAALAGGLANSALQIASGQKFNPLEALISAGGAYAGAGGFSGAEAGINPDVGGITDASQISNVADYVSANPTSSLATAQQLTNPSLIPPDAGSYAGSVQNVYDPGMISSTALETYGPGGMPNVGPVTDAAKAYTNPTVIDKISQFGDTVKSGITNLYQDPLGTIQRAAGSAFDYANDPKNLGTIATVGGLSGLALLGSQLGVPRNEGEDDESYAKRLAETQGYITQYGRNLKITNPYFYQREGAVNPFAPTMAANGGIMGYAKGGSMVPPARQIEGGVIELDARKTGGYIPYGKKERVDDVPAMLAKDEFVFTSRAVKAAGGGSARRGAAKMYALMKQLESKGARA